MNSLTDGSRIKFLITDNAPSFFSLVNNHQICWVHEIRKYKLLEVHSFEKIRVLGLLQCEWVAFYKLIKKFKKNITEKLRQRIKNEFDRICSIKTHITAAVNQLKRTLANKEKLLLFFKYPQVPIHNNLTERDIRERVIKRKISLQNRSLEGMKSWDLMLSLVSTCRKFKLSF